MYDKAFIELLKTCNGKSFNDIKATVNWQSTDKKLRQLCRYYKVRCLRPPPKRSKEAEEFLKIASGHTYKEVSEILNITVQQAHHFATHYGVFCIDERNHKTFDRDWSPSTISKFNLDALKRLEGNTLRLIKMSANYPYSLRRLQLLLARYKIWYKFENSRTEIVTRDEVKTLSKIGHELTLEQISRMCSITVSQARNLCARKDIKYRRKNTGRDLEIADAFKVLKSVRQTCEYLNISEASVRKVVKSLNM